jgi:acetyl-CoA carboxylase biotin carboxyl carrier protein
VRDGNRGGADVAFDREGLDRVIRAFEDGDWDEIHLKADGIELHLSVGATAGDEPIPPGSASRAAADVTASPAATEMTSFEAAYSGAAHSEANPGSPGQVAAAPAASGPAGAVAVAAPCPGIFWRSPRPGAPPYAAVGDDVETGATLCIIEVMKLMNHVTAERAGTVADVVASNGMQVERGQLLFWLVPHGPDPC